MEIRKLKQIIFAYLIGTGKRHYRELSYHDFQSQIVGPYEINGDTIDNIDRFAKGFFKETKSARDFVEVQDVKNITEEHTEKLKFACKELFEIYFKRHGFSEMHHSVLEGLRCLGYAVPIMGYSVDALVAMGIYRIKL